MCVRQEDVLIVSVSKMKEERLRYWRRPLQAKAIFTWTRSQAQPEGMPSPPNINDAHWYPFFQGKMSGDLCINFHTNYLLILLRLKLDSVYEFLHSAYSRNMIIHNVCSPKQASPRLPSRLDGEHLVSSTLLDWLYLVTWSGSRPHIPCLQWGVLQLGETVSLRCKQGLRFFL